MELTLADLAAEIDGRVAGDGDRRIAGVQTLEAAGPEHLSFVTHPRYRSQAESSRAGALLVGEDWQGDTGHDLLVAREPSWALARILEKFHPRPRPRPGVHPTAVVGAGCSVGTDVAIGPYTVVGEGTVIGDRAVLEAGVVVGRDCGVGEETWIHPRVVLYDRTRIGARCILHAGAVLGSDGYGFATHEGRHVKVPQIGRVVVEDDVEVGANTTIDRAMLTETRIGAGTKIDNLVQVGHNVTVGEHSMLVAQTGVAGSTRLGRYVALGGQAGVVGHIELGDGVQVAAASAVLQSVPAGETMAGYPARPVAQWRREQALTRRLEELWRRLRRLESASDEEEGDGESEG